MKKITNGNFFNITYIFYLSYSDIESWLSVSEGSINTSMSKSTDDLQEHDVAMIVINESKAMLKYFMSFP